MTQAHRGEESGWDWKFIGGSLAVPKRTTIQTGSLPIREYYKLIVGASVRQRSLAAQSQAVLLDGVNEWWGAWAGNLEFEAAQLGISPEQLFVNIVREGTPKGSLGNSSVVLPDELTE